jgi:hypothetical protein
METTRKITVEIRADLLRKAQEASGSGITETVRAGLELMAASLPRRRGYHPYRLSRDRLNVVSRPEFVARHSSIAEQS